MGISSSLLNAPKEFLALFKEGKEAARSGNKAKARDLFRQAIEVDPYHEQVWLWLASVVDNDEDKRVCFENVLELNPTNPTARQQIQALIQRQGTGQAQDALSPADKKSRRRKRSRRIRRVVLVLLIVGGSVLAAISYGVI